jgi:hypothetical protein
MRSVTYGNAWMCRKCKIFGAKRFIGQTFRRLKFGTFSNFNGTDRYGLSFNLFIEDKVDHIFFASWNKWETKPNRVITKPNQQTSAKPYRDLGQSCDTVLCTEGKNCTVPVLILLFKGHFSWTEIVFYTDVTACPLRAIDIYICTVHIYWIPVLDCVYQLMLQHGCYTLLPTLPRWSYL